jgi:uncharacterized protein YlaN (UPF0358 family)
MIPSLTNCREWEFLNIENEPIINKCFKLYILGNDYAKITEEEIINSLHDINDYKNVAALGFLLLANYHFSEIDIKHKFLEGLERISKKKISPMFNLIYDETALLGILVPIKKFLFKEYYSWSKDIIFEHKKNLIERKQNYDIAIALEEFLNDANFSNKPNSDEYNVVFAWLSLERNNEKMSFSNQLNFFQKVWKVGMPYFNNQFLDCIACGVIDKLIAYKFDYGLLNIEEKYKNAVEQVKKKSNRITKLLTISIVLFTIIALLGFIYSVAIYEINSDENKWYIRTIVSLLGSSGVFIGLIKSWRKIHEIIYTRIYSHTLVKRRLN